MRVRGCQRAGELQRISVKVRQQRSDRVRKKAPTVSRLHITVSAGLLLWRGECCFYCSGLSPVTGSSHSECTSSVGVHSLQVQTDEAHSGRVRKHRPLLPKQLT